MPGPHHNCNPPFIGNFVFNCPSHDVRNIALHAPHAPLSVSFAKVGLAKTLGPPAHGRLAYSNLGGFLKYSVMVSINKIPRPVCEGHSR
jgi:hypothetical protein